MSLILGKQELIRQTYIELKELFSRSHNSFEMKKIKTQLEVALYALHK
jgi:hypothetical protein